MSNVIGIDIGGTSIVGGRVEKGVIIHQITVDTQANIGGEFTLLALRKLIKELITPETKAIGIGVPSVVDRVKGIIYNVQNIKDWDEVHIKKIIQEEFNLPVFVDNDANCFSLGEKIYGEGHKYENFVGITLGTGVGGGIIQNNHLMKDANCGSGEFGEIPYLESIIENYCGSRFFPSFTNMSGKEVAEKANNGNTEAIEIFNHYGIHIASLVKIIMLTVDPQAIIFGGSISQSFNLFEKSLYENLKDFPYPNSVKNLQILTSNLKDIGVLGAASLCIDSDKM